MNNPLPPPFFPLFKIDYNTEFCPHLFSEAKPHAAGDVTPLPSSKGFSLTSRLCLDLKSVLSTPQIEGERTVPPVLLGKGADKAAAPPAATCQPPAGPAVPPDWHKGRGCSYPGRLVCGQSSVQDGAGRCTASSSYSLLCNDVSSSLHLVCSSPMKLILKMWFCACFLPAVTQKMEVNPAGNVFRSTFST